MSRPTPNEHGEYRIIWPQVRMVTPEKLMGWASDEINTANGTESYRVADVEEAIEVLEDTGTVTFASNANRVTVGSYEAGE
jgi:hypothetical protein